MSATEFYVGQDVTLRMSVTNPDGTAAEPTDVKFKIKPPTGDVIEKGLGDSGTEDLGAGEYSLTFDLTESGSYRIRAEAFTGSDIVGVGETVVYSLASLVV